MAQIPERAALIELLTETIAADRFTLSPRVQRLRAILAKLGVGHPLAQPYPAPKPPGERSAVPGKKRRW